MELRIDFGRVREPSAVCQNSRKDMRNTYRDLFVFAIVLAIVAICGNIANSQTGQINHPNASQLNYSGSSTPNGWNVAPQWMPGPFLVNLGPGPGNLVTFTQGLQGVYFETYISNGSPKVGFFMPNGDIVHLNLTALWSLNPVFSGVTPCNQLTCPTQAGVGPWGALATSWPYNGNVTFNFTVQSWVSDPSRLSGYRLTAAINVVK
jgi:hypothetical protein